MDILNVSFDLEGLITFIEVPRDRTVIDLIGNGKSGFILVCGSDKVGVRSNTDLTLS